MPGKRKITIKTLTELGAHKLAELLMAEAAGNRQLEEAINERPRQTLQFETPAERFNACGASQPTADFYREPIDWLRCTELIQLPDRT